MPESSDKTRVIVVDHAEPSPTVKAYGLGNCKYSQVYVEGPEMLRKHVRADDGLPIPLPPSELLEREPADSPVFRAFSWNPGKMFSGQETE